ncbi:MAG: hypothetical protein JWQ17_4236, partial [Tardiphaga sp.]|nr:hypothetical protein [Tardiphaga sp.]
ALGGQRQAACLGDGDEEAKVSKFHVGRHAFRVCRQTYKVFFAEASFT